MNHKAVTMIEFVLAVAVMGAALVPITGSMLSYFKRVTTIEGSLGFTNRAQALLNTLLDDVSFGELYGAKGLGDPAGATDVTQGTPVKILDLTKFLKRDGKQVCPLDSGAEGNTQNGMWLVDGEGTYFKSNNVKYHFYLELTNIPLLFHWKQWQHNENHNGLGSPPFVRMPENDSMPNVQTMDYSGRKRDMFMQITLFVKWQEYGRNLDFSFVTFKANLDNSNDK